LSRLALLSLPAAAFVVLTGIYGDSARPRPPNPNLQEERRHRPSAPDVSLFPELVGEGMVVAIYAVAGRLVLRLRLSPVSRSERQLIVLDLQRE
jgi:hypothetical protein